MTARNLCPRTWPSHRSLCVTSCGLTGRRGLGALSSRRAEPFRRTCPYRSNLLRRRRYRDRPLLDRFAQTDRVPPRFLCGVDLGLPVRAVAIRIELQAHEHALGDDRRFEDVGQALRVSRSHGHVVVLSYAFRWNAIMNVKLGAPPAPPHAQDVARCRLTVLATVLRSAVRAVTAVNVIRSA